MCLSKQKFSLDADMEVADYGVFVTPQNCLKNLVNSETISFEAQDLTTVYNEFKGLKLHTIKQRLESESKTIRKVVVDNIKMDGFDITKSVKAVWGQTLAVACFDAKPGK